MPNSELNPRRTLRYVMIAVLVWGVILSIGVYYRWRKWQGFLLVLSCTLVFVGIWKLLLMFGRPPTNRD